MANSLNWADLVKDAGDGGGGGDFSPLPQGEYDLLVQDVTIKETAKGKTMFVVKSEVQTGQFAKRLLWDNLVVSPESSGAMGFFFRKMRALGLNEQYFAQNPSDEHIAEAMKGRPFKGRVKQSVYNGQTRNEFDSYAAAGQATPSFGGGGGAPAPTPAAAPAPAPAAAPAPAPQAAPAAPAPAPAPAAPAAAPAAPAAPPVDPWATQAPAAPATGPAAPPAPPF